MLLRRGLFLLGAVATLFESSWGFLLPAAGPNTVGRATATSREQHHHQVTFIAR